MNNKQLIKVIKTLVEVETAKQQERFLSKTFPKILEEEVNKRLAEVKGGLVSAPSTQLSEDNVVDPFKMANQVLENERQEEPKRKFSKNTAINEVLNNTQPFSKEQRSGGNPQTKSVLDSFQKPQVNESMDKTVEFTQQGAGAGVDGIRASMAAQMGYSDMPGVGGKKQGGLGVTTGLAGLDRILNRDNSALVKKFKK